jgi:hypothetical protein
MKGFDLDDVPPNFSSGQTDFFSKPLTADQTKRLGQMQSSVQCIKNISMIIKQSKQLGRTQNGIQGIKNH